MQNLQLYRGKKGMDTMFDHNEVHGFQVPLTKGLVAQQELMQQLRIFLEIHELWRQIDPDGPMAKRVLEEYKALPRDMPREQLTEQGKCLGSQPAWHMRSVKGLRQGFTALLVEGSVHSIARALLEVTSSSFGFGTVMAHHFSTAARTESHLS